MKRRLLILAATTAIAIIAVVGIRLWTRSFNEGLLRYKVARRTNAVIIRKEYLPDRDGYIVFFRIPAFAVMNYGHKGDELTQEGLDTRRSDALVRAERMREQRDGLRHSSISKQDYDNIEVGESITVVYRLESTDADIEIIGIATVPAELKYSL